MADGKPCPDGAPCAGGTKPCGGCAERARIAREFRAALIAERNRTAVYSPTTRKVDPARQAAFDAARREALARLRARKNKG